MMTRLNSIEIVRNRSYLRKFNTLITGINQVDRGPVEILREAQSQMRALGATACRAHPKVLKNIAKQLEQHHILSAQELQIARLMGIVTTHAIARPSFNNRIFLGTNSPPAVPVHRRFQKRLWLQSTRRGRKNGTCTPSHCWSTFPTTRERDGLGISKTCSLTRRTGTR